VFEISPDTDIYVQRQYLCRINHMTSTNIGANIVDMADITDIDDITIKNHLPIMISIPRF